ncbi:MAG: bifunctional riboflavin kinase/FAD synthetase [Legionellales bacterium]|nr:bifunctional riboflavin kinase/FAD synthetase [Legionellales bacterium]
MKIIRGLHNLPVFTQKTAVSIGNFDGLHLGHQRIIEMITQVAKQQNLLTVVILFEPQPLEFFNAESAPARLTPLHEKFKLLAEAGIDYLVCLYFNQKLSQMPASVFIQQILLDHLKVAYLLVGHDFRFGYRREGDFDLLKNKAQNEGFQLANCPAVQFDNVRISSTRVRDALQRSDFAEAARLLGRSYSLEGHVKFGEQRGRLLGFPTANLLLKHDKLILSGVFAVEVEAESFGFYRGVANLGVRPTINSGLSCRLEVYLFDFNGNLYGKRLKVIFRAKIRDEQRFSNVEALKKQIQQDVLATETFFQMGKYDD